MKNWKSSILILAALVLMSSVHEAHAQSQQPANSSAKSSPKSDIRATKKVESEESRVEIKIDLADRKPNSPLSTSRLIPACMAAVEELETSRTLINGLEAENSGLKARLATEKQMTVVLTELNETRRSEADALRATVAAKNETITAKDAVIAQQDKLVETLKSKRPSPWRRIGDILIGAAVFAILK